MDDTAAQADTGAPRVWPHEERLNTVTHAAGALASAAGSVLLVIRASTEGDAFAIVGCAIFGATLLLLYTASTLYHAVRSPARKQRLRVFDHCAIYALIAGTYTPFTLVGLRGPWGWSLFGVLWGLAFAGIGFKLFFTGRYERLSTVIYIAMGWMGLVAAVPLSQRLPFDVLVWLVAGGVAYTAGTIFFSSRRIPYTHAIWHLFVLAGSLCHGVAIALMVGRTG
jgi:hemolysin III